MVYKPQEAKKPGDQQKGFTRTGRGGQVEAALRVEDPAAFFSICQNNHIKTIRVSKSGHSPTSKLRSRSSFACSRTLSDIEIPPSMRASSSERSDSVSIRIVVEVSFPSACFFTR